MAVKPIPEGYGTVTPYLLVEDVRGIVSFMERAFGASDPRQYLSEDGKVMHAEVVIGNSRIMLGEANEQWPAMPAMLHLYVEDVDDVYRRAIEAGGTSIRELRDEFYGDRSGGVRDPWGNQWWIATHVEDVSKEEMARRHQAQAAERS